MVISRDDAVTRLLRQKGTGWIGVDLDGTLFTYDEWIGWNRFGEPIVPMIQRVLGWIAEGHVVKIVTARVGLPLFNGVARGVCHAMRHSCRVTGVKFSDYDMMVAIWNHCAAHGLPELPIQCYKDAQMIELWDDRAVQVEPNTGRTLADAHEAELSALRGKSFQGFSKMDEVCFVCGGPCQHPDLHMEGKP